MGKVVSTLIRPIRNFNVEERARSVISKEKPTQAPQFESTKKLLEAAQKMDPEFMEKHLKKDTKLENHLKDVFVVSSDPMPDLSNRSDPNRSLPKSKKSYEYADFQLYESENVKEGRCTLKQVQTILTNYQEDPIKHTADSIAEKYKLDKKDVENLLLHYRVFQIFSEDDRRKSKEEEKPKLDDR